MAQIAAPVSAMSTVIAIGVNILPSTPVSVRIGDDHHAEQARARDLAGPGKDRLEPFRLAQRAAALMLLRREQAQAILDDDHDAIDDDAEVDRAQAHQIGADLVLNHPGHREQHRQRDDQGGDQGGAHIAEEQEQDHHDQEGAFKEVAFDGRDRRLDEAGAIVDSARDDAVGKRFCDLLEPRRYPLRNGAAVLADQQHRRAENGLLAVERCGTRP
jgi:hypothetical protein